MDFQHAKYGTSICEHDSSSANDGVVEDRSLFRERLQRVGLVKGSSLSSYDKGAVLFIQRATTSSPSESTVSVIVTVQVCIIFRCVLHCSPLSIPAKEVCLLQLSTYSGQSPLYNSSYNSRFRSPHFDTSGWAEMLNLSRHEPRTRQGKREEQPDFFRDHPSK